MTSQENRYASYALPFPPVQQNHAQDSAVGGDISVFVVARIKTVKLLYQAAGVGLYQPAAVRI